MGRIGILGSYFDPIHEGHLKIAEQSAEQLALDKVLFVPVVNGINKVPVASIRERIGMILASIEYNEKFEVADIESELLNKGLDVTTFGVLSSAKEKHKDSDLFYIAGADKLQSLSNWKNFSSFNSLVKIILTKRDGYNIDDTLVNYIRNTYNIDIFLTSQDTILCSSSMIREKIGKSDLSGLEYLLNKAVLDYICTNDIYRNPI